MTRWLVAALLLVGGAAAAPGRADPFDFVVQQVCVDGADKAVAGDPAHCASKRKLRIGEPIPYRRVDAGNWQALYSYPVRGLDGEPRAVAAKVFGGADASGSFTDLGVRSGYDLLEVGDRYVSGIRTSDQGAGDQIFWRTTDCVRQDGWIMFPPGLQPGQSGEVRSTLKITPGPSTACPQLKTIAPDYTVWSRPTEPYRYTSGKALDTIQSMHFAYGDPWEPSHTNDSMEKFYFTKEYGFSRWEAWETPDGCEARARTGGTDPGVTCRPSSTEICNGPNTATFFDKTYLRLDCRDSTFYAADAEGVFNPLVSAVAPGDIVSRNLLANGSFFDGRAGWEVSDGARFEPMREPRSHNAVLRLGDTPGVAALAQGFAVPADLLGAGRVLRWGATLASPRRPLQGHLKLTLTREGAAPVVVDRAIEMGATPRPAGFTTPLPPSGPLTGRLELFLSDGAGATVDDAFAAVIETR